ncbi:poly-gamma-glutamate biosynthesis protein PgsC/CapC [Desulfoplanes sp. PS50]
MIQIPLFPPSSLASSVDATVWVGVCVVCIFNLRLGWVLSGLVVPGYLVPLIMTRPWSAAAIFVEAVVTYVLVWFFFEFLTRLRWWANVFGRDRFFALLIVSVLVRLVFDTMLFPALGQAMNEFLNISFDYQNNLHSFGLIVVALMANQFWKPGFARGMVPLVMSTVITWLLVRYVLMTATNFSLGSLAYMYEDLAVSMLTGPKAYIILLTTAFVASRMNVRYGWDYSGILIPALLALQWHQPFKILTTVVEALFILLVGTLLLKLPVFKKMTMEGARKLLFFFNLGFIYKVVLGHLILAFFPEHRISDYYGFGYLLTTLLAVKMHDKDIMIRMTRSTLQTSLTSLVLASMIGFSLTFLPNILAETTDDLVTVSPEPTDSISLEQAVSGYKIALYSSPSRDQEPPTARDREIFALALRNLKSYRITGRDKDLQQAGDLLARVRYGVRFTDRGIMLLEYRGAGSGWGLFAIDKQPGSELLVQVPEPMREWGVMQGGAWLFGSLKAGALAIAGKSAQSLDIVDPLAERSSFMFLFQQAFGEQSILQVRGYTASSVRALTGERVRPGFLGEVSPPSALWIKSSTPSGLNMTTLREIVGSVDVHWGKTPLSNPLRAVCTGEFAELLLDRKDMRTLLFKPFFQQDLRAEQTEQSIVGYLQSWLMGGKGRIAARGSREYRVPLQAELLYFDQEILTPLVALIQREYHKGEWTRDGLEELRLLSAGASMLGYEVVRYHHRSKNENYLILSERDDADPKRSWGTYVFRLGTGFPLMIQIPRPLSEINVFEYAVSLFERTSARYLLIGGAHPRTNPDRSADLLDPENQANVFNLVNQVILRQLGDESLGVLQCRAFGLRPGIPLPEADVLMALPELTRSETNLVSVFAGIHDILENDGLTVRFVDGAPGFSGYEAGGIPQSLYLDQSRNKTFAVLWLSPSARIAYRQQTENRFQEMQFLALGIPSIQGDLFQVLDRASCGDSATLPASMREQLAHYMGTQDITALERVVRDRPGYGFERVMDVNSHHGFLVIRDREGLVRLVVNLLPRKVDTYVKVRVPLVSRTGVDRFVNSRAGWLEFVADRSQLLSSDTP